MKYYELLCRNYAKPPCPFVNPPDAVERSMPAGFFFTTTTDTENISHHISTQIAKLRPMTFTTFGSTSSIWFFAYLAIAVKKRRGGNERVGHLQQN